MRGLFAVVRVPAIDLELAHVARARGLGPGAAFGDLGILRQGELDHFDRYFRVLSLSKPAPSARCTPRRWSSCRCAPAGSRSSPCRLRVEPGQRVLHPVLVVALGKVLARMRAAAFGAVERRIHGDHRLRDQVVEFERLDQVGVPDQRAVGDLDVAAPRRRPRGSACRLPPASRRCGTRRSCSASPSASRAAARAVGVPPLALRNLSSRDSAQIGGVLRQVRLLLAGRAPARRSAAPRRGRTPRGRSASWSRAGWRRAPRRRPPRRAPSGRARRCRRCRCFLVSTSP